MLRRVERVVFSVWFGPCTTLVLLLLSRNTDPGQWLASALFPEEHSIGCIAVRLSSVPHGKGAGEPSGELFLLRHEAAASRRVVLFHRGGTIVLDPIAVGTPGRSAEAWIADGGVGGVNFLELELPPRTLLAASASFASTPSDGARYFLKDDKLEKEFRDPEDLLVQTRNEALNTRLFYWFSIGTVFVVGVFIPRFAQLRFPSDEHLQTVGDSQATEHGGTSVRSDRGSVDTSETNFRG